VLTARAPTFVQAKRPRVFHFAETCGAIPVCEPLSAIHFSSRAMSPALCQRSSGSFARHCFTARSNAGGARGCKLESGGGSDDRMAVMMLALVLPLNAAFPVSISYS